MSHNSQKVLTGLKKAQSSLNKVIKMVESDRYCIDVIQQTLSVVGLLKSVNLALLEGHVNGCVRTAVKQKNEAKLDEMMAELIRVINIAQKK